MMSAVTYFIAGKSNCPFFARAQRIGEMISQQLPSVAVRIQSQHPTEWPAYLSALCDRLAFKHAASPIVYTQFGTLIGGSDAFVSLVKKKYGDIVDIPSTILSDLASENFDLSATEMQKKEAIQSKKLNEEQWELRNERLEVIETKALRGIESRTEKVSLLVKACQHVKAILEISPEKYKIPEELRYLQNHLVHLSRTLPEAESIEKDIEELLRQADEFGSIPSQITNADGTHFSRTPDATWRHMIMDHRNLLVEFTKLVFQMHEANQLVQDEVTNLVQKAPPPAIPPPNFSPIPPTSITPSSSSSSISSSSSRSATPIPIPIDRFQKSVSFAALDSQYSPKEPAQFHSLPTTPKKREEEEPSTPPQPQMDTQSFRDAQKAMIAVVDEGLSVLKSARKQARLDHSNTVKQISSLRKVLDEDHYRMFQLRERREIGKNIHLFRFDLPSGTDTLGCPLGKHIFVKIGEVERAYSPITTDFDQGHFDLAVKVTRDTPMMDYFANLSVGDWGPIGVHILKESEPFSGVAMFAHGVGLTPMLQIIRHFLSQDIKTPLWLLYFNAEERTFFKEELERLSVHHTRFNLRYITSKPGNHWEHLQTQDLAQSLPFRPAGFDFSSETHPTKIFICGTKNFTKRTKSLLHDIGHRSEYIHTF